MKQPRWLSMPVPARMLLTTDDDTGNCRRTTSVSSVSPLERAFVFPQVSTEKTAFVSLSRPIFVSVAFC